jgi:hypothetical protein
MNRWIFSSSSKSHGCMNSILLKVRKKWAFPLFLGDCAALSLKEDQMKREEFVSIADQCNRGCSVHADFICRHLPDFPGSEIRRKIDLFVNSMVREVMTDKEGKATGVSYINRQMIAQEYELKGKIVRTCCIRL